MGKLSKKKKQQKSLHQKRWGKQLQNASNSRDLEGMFLNENQLFCSFFVGLAQIERLSVENEAHRSKIEGTAGNCCNLQATKLVKCLKFSLQ